MMFSNMNVICIDSFFYFHNDCENEMSHFDKTIDEDKNVSLNYTRENIK